MPTSKKPRKKYRPPAGPLSIGRIKTFRYSTKGDNWLKLMPHQALESLRDGTATPQNFDTLVLRVHWGERMAADHLLHPDEAREVMARGVAAVTAIADRFARLGKFGATGEEFGYLGDALNLCDQIQDATTRREQEASLLAVINRSQQELRQMASSVSI